MIRLNNLSKRFGEQILCDDLSIQFPQQARIALVGPNGAGKSTLLNILTRQEPADSGEILIAAKFKMGYLPQEPNPKPRKTILEECLSGDEKYFSCKESLEEIIQLINQNPNDPKLLERYESVDAEFSSLDGFSKEAKANTILDGLGFSESQRNTHPRTLSGGWRMRLELAKIFINEVDFLILDEPTNHLDLPSLAWVEQYLRNFQGTLLFVSHDRALLNRLATHTFFLNQGKLESYPCPYDQFLAKREERLITQEAEELKTEKKKEHLQSFVDRFGAKASKAKQAQSRLKSIEKIEKNQAKQSRLRKQSSKITISIPTPPKSAREVLEVCDLSIGYTAEKPLYKNLQIKLERGQKVAIIGANGIGKSTLLRTIAEKQSPLAGLCQWGKNTFKSYFSQIAEENLDLESSVLDNLLSSSYDLGEPEARNILARFLFSANDVSKPAAVLSGGEKNRAALAKLFITKSNVLLLDEPTNHLDMASIDALTDSLREYSGTLLFVSHDRSFIDALCSHIFVMTADGRSMMFAGKLDDYERMAPKFNFPNILSFDTSSATAPRKEGNESTKQVTTESAAQHQLIKSLKNKRSKLTKEIERLELLQEKIASKAIEIEAELSEAYQTNRSPVELNKIAAQLKESQQKAEDAENKWLFASNELELIEAQMRKTGRFNI